jgi:tetratricopeptide (TPR) repeat protein
MTDGSRGEDHLKQGRHLFSEGLLTDDRTLLHLRKALKSRDGIVVGNVGFIFWMIGECHRARGESALAENAFSPALELLDEGDQQVEIAIAARSSLADVQFSQKHFSKAEPHYRRLLEVDRGNQSAADWLVCLATCVAETQPRKEALEEAVVLTTEAFELLISDGPDIDVVTEFPYERALLQCMTIRAICLTRIGQQSEAIKEFEAAEAYGRERLGPVIALTDLAPLYKGWIEAYESLDRHDEAARVREHGERVVTEN